MSALLDSDAYKGVRVLHADWDTIKSTDMAKTLKLNRRSTLIAYKGGEEVGRVIAQTSKDAIEPLFQACTS